MDMNNSPRPLPPMWRSSVPSPTNTSNSKKLELPESSNSCPVVGPESPYKKDHKMPSDSSKSVIGNLRKNPCHRRAHSDVLTLLGDLSLDNELGVLGGLDRLSNPDENEEGMLPDLILDTFSSTYDELPTSAPESGSTYVAPALTKNPQSRLQHSQSFEGVTAQMINPGSENPSQAEAEITISAANLAELAVTDPKHAKRIWANRQSAARSKERKMRYITDLQNKVQIMQSEKATLSMQFALMQSDTNGLASENIEFKLQLQSLEQQVHMQDALNNTLKEEIQKLKVLTGQAIPNGQPLMHHISASYGANHQHPTKNHSARPLMTAQPMQNQFRQHQMEQFQPRQLLLH